MDTEKVLFDDGNHKCIRFSFDDESLEESFLAVNQYLIINNQEGILLDPGGNDIYDVLYEKIKNYIDINNLKYIFFSHQDPDVADSISLWSISTEATFLISNLWSRFMSHYGLMDMGRIEEIYDKGTKISLGSETLDIIPAHFLHSPGNFSLFDLKSKILFSGDIGANIFPHYDMREDILDFDLYKEYALAFHQRYMAGNIFCKAWVNEIRKRDVKTIASQHGMVLKDEMSKKFLDWFENLQCGGDLIDNIY